MDIPNEYQDSDRDEDARTFDLPICKPIGIAFPPAQSGQTNLSGVVVISGAPQAQQSCLINITSTNPQLLTVQPTVVVGTGQTTADVQALVASQSVAAAVNKANAISQSVVYVLATYGQYSAPPARVMIPGAQQTLKNGHPIPLPSVKSLTFDPIVKGQSSVNGIVTLHGPAPKDGVDVNLGSTNPYVFAVLQQVHVAAHSDTASVTALITPPADETCLIAFATIGDEPPVQTLVTVPAQR